MRFLGRSRRERRGGLLVLGSALAVGLLFWAGPASATGTLDANNPGPATGSATVAAFSFCPFCNPEPNNFAAQTFTAASSGLLDTVQVQFWLDVSGISNANPGDLVVKVEGMGVGLLAGKPDDSNVLASQTVLESSITQTANGVTSVVFSNPALVQAGTQYALVLAPASGLAGPGFNTYMVGTTGDTYSGGEYCTGGGLAGWSCNGSTDTVFATFVSPPPPPAAVGLSPASVGFGAVPVGTTSTPQTVTITNTAASGSQPLAIGTLAIGGANLGDFTLGNDNCSNTSVTPGNSCSAAVSFGPTIAGARNATLAIPSNAASSPDQVALNGTGTPQADVSLNLTGPASAAKGRQISYLITVSNAGPSTAHNVVLSDPVPAGVNFVGATTSKGTCSHSGGTVKCALGDLASGGSAGSAVNVKITARVGGTITNIASAYSTANNAGPATFDPNTSNNWQPLTTHVT
jgi:uncharacterized repeat protein (TIGR01451 family)